MADIQREDRSGKQRLQVVFQPLGPVQDNLHRLRRLRPEPTLSRFGPRPRRRPLATCKRAPDFLVHRPVQPAILAPPQCVQHHHHHFLAVLALVPFLPPLLAATALTLGLPPMTLATTSTALGVPPPWTTPLA